MDSMYYRIVNDNVTVLVGTELSWNIVHIILIYLQYGIYVRLAYKYTM